MKIAVPKIDILGFIYTIHFVPDMTRKEGRNGTMDGKEKTIRIDADDLGPEQRCTLIHEILEAINRELSLDLNHDGHICKLDTALFQVFESNPHLVELFLYKEGGKIQEIEERKCRTDI